MWPKDDPLTNKQRVCGSEEKERRKKIEDTLFCHKTEMQTSIVPLLAPPMSQCFSFLIFFCLSSTSRCFGSVSACMDSKCWELNWKWSSGTHNVSHRAQLGEEGHSGFTPYQMKSHTWSTDPSGAIIPEHMRSGNPKLMLVLWPLSWRRSCPRRKMSLKENYQHYSSGERLQIWHRETEDCSDCTDLDSTGRNSFCQ